MKDLLISQIAAYALSLLSPDVVKDPTRTVHLQGDHIGIAVIDFNTKQYKSVHIIKKKIVHNVTSPIYFDLASLTKPLTLASTYLTEPQVFEKEDMLLLNHRGGLPAVFKVEENSDEWRTYVEHLQVKESRVVKYSDTSAVRLMMNLEKKHIDIHELSHKWLDPEVMYWKDLPEGSTCPTTGKRLNMPIRCVVHDPTAFKINSFVTNSGMFGTIDGVAKTLINLNSNNYNLNQVMKSHLPKATNRFVMGWELNKFVDIRPGGVTDEQHVFGHRGYTGTSIWINTKLNIGMVILTNTSSLENGKNANAITSSKHLLRQKLTDYLWKLTKSKFRKI